MTWNLERTWQVTIDDKTEELSTVELSRFRCVVMLGAAGAGKTTEAERLASHESALGRRVRRCRLAEFADTSAELGEQLATLSVGASEDTVLYLDALDEAMIPARRRWLAIKHLIANKLHGTGTAIRITCRPAVWPSELSDVVREFAGHESFATAFLQSLDDDDIGVAAASLGIDPEAFLERLESTRARSLAGQPLALRMLMKLYQSECGLPRSLSELFEKGIERLVSDPQERHDIGTQIQIPTAAMIEAAEWLACYTMLSGRETVCFDEEPLPNALSVHDLSTKFTLEDLHAIGSSGICDSTSPASFRFGHRQFAEFLGGRRLARLPAHQARALLASPDGWSKGVAGPLRETAAFAAMFNPDLAEWMSACDPDVIGLSDVADSNLRRKATLALLDRFRRTEMTDAQLWPGDVELRGLQYDGAAADLRPVLSKVKQGDVGDDAKCAIKLAGDWKLSSLANDLADVVLDTTVPLPNRTAAGHALSKCGAASAQERLKPLVRGVPEDESDELKGMALHCTWPDRLSTPELLAALTRPRRPSLYGAYKSFLWRLHEEGFTATGHRSAALRWAKTCISELGDTDVLHRIATRVAHAAMRDLADPSVARELVELLRHWAKYYKSPLAALPTDTLEHQPEHELDKNAPLRAAHDARRRLIEELVCTVESREELLELAYRTPGLLNVVDFLWLLEKGCDERLEMAAREKCLHFASMLPWEGRSDNVDAWLQVCDGEPVRTILGNQRSVELDSEEATQLRNRWEMIHEDRSTRETQVLDPPPRDRVANVLTLCETKDIRHFGNLCRELTLEPTSTHYGAGERFLTSTPGWREAAPETQDRIVNLAKAYLSTEGLATEAADRLSPLSFYVDVFGAIWLILERDPDWLKARSGSWWRDWCWYMVRELIPNMVDEPYEPKQQIMKLLNEKSPDAVCREIQALVSGQDDGYADLLRDLLALLRDEPNVELDERLCEAIRAGTIVERHATCVAEFVLVRAPEKSILICLEIMNGALTGAGEAWAEHVAVAQLGRRAREGWDGVKAFLRFDTDRGRRVLRRFAHDEGSGFIESMSVRQLGELTEDLVELFPPETDPKSEGVTAVTPDDSARTLRDRMISYLSRLEDSDAVEALRQLERRFVGRYPWLRRPRSQAERAFRLSRWLPCPIDVIGDVLAAGDRRLMRSEEDVVDGIEYAVDAYASALRADGGESVEDLWNTATGTDPTPKSEEHVSSKLCAAVRSYFQEYAVAADREVEIHRRSLSRAQGGEPGSEVDILVQFSGHGTVSGDAVRVPVEVKLSFNNEAKTGFRTQLADRYMPQLGASHGVYVVVWMDLPPSAVLPAKHRPKWPSLESAREDLRQEAERLGKEKGIRVRTVIVDATLR